METGKFEIEVHNARILDIAQSIISDTSLQKVYGRI